MKKFVLVLLLAALAAAGAFAQSLGGDSSRSPIQLSAGLTTGFGSLDGGIDGVRRPTHTIFSSGGFISFGAFFDATYVETSLTFKTVPGRVQVPTTGLWAGYVDASLGFLSIQALAKYPFSGTFFEIFPLAGLAYDIGVWSDREGYEPADYSRLLFKFGGGFNSKSFGTGGLFNKIYIRLNLLVDIGLLTPDEQAEKDAGADISVYGFSGFVGLGYRF
jgi:hypothetical protein